MRGSKLFWWVYIAIYKFCNVYNFNIFFSKKYVIFWEVMKSINMLVKCFIRTLIMKQKLPDFQDLLQMINTSSDRFTINLCEFSPQYVQKMHWAVNVITSYLQGSHHVWKTGKTGKIKSVREKSGNLILVKMSGNCQGILFQIAEIVIFMAKAHNFMK